MLRSAINNDAIGLKRRCGRRKSFLGGLVHCVERERIVLWSAGSSDAIEYTYSRMNGDVVGATATHHRSARAHAQLHPHMPTRTPHTWLETIYTHVCTDVDKHVQKLAYGPPWTPISARMSICLRPTLVHLHTWLCAYPPVSAQTPCHSGAARDN